LCIGAIDGKHIRIQAPANSGTQYFNYKHTFSVVLLAMCDANYCFTIVDIGACGRQSDGGVLYNSNFGRALREGKLDIPSPSSLPHSTDVAPYVVAGDEAFPLQNNMLRPYPGRNLTQKQKVFNYHLSRARRIIENTFGIIATKCRILHRPIHATPEKCESYIKAICCLHNFVKIDGASARAYCPSTTKTI